MTSKWKGYSMYWECYNWNYQKKKKLQLDKTGQIKKKKKTLLEY